MFISSSVPDNFQAKELLKKNKYLLVLDFKLDLYSCEECK